MVLCRLRGTISREHHGLNPSIHGMWFHLPSAVYRLERILSDGYVRFIYDLCRTATFFSLSRFRQTCTAGIAAITHIFHPRNLRFEFCQPKGQDDRIIDLVIDTLRATPIQCRMCQEWQMRKVHLDVAEQRIHLCIYL